MLPRDLRKNLELDSWNGIDAEDLDQYLDEDSIEILDNDLDEDRLKELKILNYLMGKPLSSDDESDVLQSLQNTNAACIEDLLQIVGEEESTPSSRPQSERSSQESDSANDAAPRKLSPTLEVASSMRLRISTMELSPEGLNQIQSPKHSTSGLLFVITYQPPRSSMLNVPIRLCSKRVCNNIVSFEQEKFHSCESSKPIKFTIYVKKNGCQETLFGEALLDWTKILHAENQKSDLSLIVQCDAKKNVVGKLKIRAKIGNGNEVALKKDVVSQLNKPVKADVAPEKNVVKPIPDVQIVEEVREEVKNSPAARSPNKSVLLRSLFLASSVRKCKEQFSTNLFLVLKAFWLDEDVKSPLSTCSKGTTTFDFHLSAPVLLSPYFLTRCKGNNAILEVWSSTSRGNELMGICLLPLHTFYLAYHDNLVTRALLDCKLPVVSVDHWLQIVSPMSGEQVGEINCLLAFGADDQVTHLEQQKGLRNSEIVPPLTNKTQRESESEECCLHVLNINVLKISDLFGTKVEAECFVKCRIPNISEIGHSFKILSTQPATCSMESKFSGKLSHNLNLSLGNSFTKFLSNQAKDCITCEVFCNFKQSKDKSIKVAETTLPLSEISFLEEQFAISNLPSYLSLALPLKTAESEVSKLVTTGKGTLVLRLEYFQSDPNETEIPAETDALTKSTISTQTEVQLSDFGEASAEGDDDEAVVDSCNSEQLWSTTLLSQLQKLRISKTASGAAKEETPKKTFRCLVQVEKAMQLPYLKSSTDTTITHSEPCTYVTISNEGDSNLSPVVLYSVDPMWNWSCTVDLPTHLLMEGGENLVLKVWQLPKCGDKPSTKSNSILCFAAVQIADLKYGLPKISGWFNLVNYSGKYCGKVFLSITPMEDLALLMFANRGSPKEAPPSAQYVPETVEVKPNPFIDLSSSVMESTLRQQMTDLDTFSTLLKSRVSPMPEELDANRSSDTDQVASVEEEKQSGSESSEDENSTNGSIDSDVARLLAKFDLQTLHKIVEQLDDEVTKMNRCSKPDYVCAKTTDRKSIEKAEDEVPAIELDQASGSDSGIASTARKRHLRE